MPIVGGLDIHRKQITFDYPGTVTGQVRRDQVSLAGRVHLRAWLARFAGRDDVAFAAEGCTGWRYLAEELAAAGVAAHLAEPADTAFARGRKRHAKIDKTDCRHLRQLLAEGRLPECWIPPGHILECRAPLETYHDLRREHTAWVQRIHAVLFHQGAPALGEGTLRTGPGLAALRAAKAGDARDCRRAPWSAPLARVVLPRRQPAVPGQQCRRRHGKDFGPAPTRYKPRLRGEPGPVGRLVPRPADVSAQYRVLVPEHQQFSILRQVAGEHQDGQAEYPAREQVDDLKQHPASQPSPRQACWR
jgi:hypothetical protein